MKRVALGESNRMNAARRPSGLFFRDLHELELVTYSRGGVCYFTYQKDGKRLYKGVNEEEKIIGRTHVGKHRSWLEQYILPDQVALFTGIRTIRHKLIENQ